MPQPTLQHGEFFGTREQRREVAGYSLLIAAADPARSVARHTHEDAHFILLLDGHYLSSARGAGHLNAEPALIYNPPGTTHQDAFPESRGRFIGISVSAARLAEAAQVTAPSEAAIRIWDTAALHTAHRLARSVAHGARDLGLEALCLELVGSFARERAIERRPPGWLVTAREVLHDRARDELTMADVAPDVGVHPVYLARVFRRFFGCTPAEYLRRCRVEQAAALVGDSQRPLAEIALACGFVDQSHFTRMFARTFATSPGAYRRRHRARS
jgi:AraC family transcriptional regulator